MEEEIQLYSVAFSDHTFIGIPTDQADSEEAATEAAKEIKRNQISGELPTVTLVELVTLK